MADLDGLPPPLEESDGEEALSFRTSNGQQQAPPPPPPFYPSVHPGMDAMFTQLQQLQWLEIQRQMTEGLRQYAYDQQLTQQQHGTHPSDMVYPAPPAAGVDHRLPFAAPQPVSESTDPPPTLLPCSDSDSDGPEAPRPFTPRDTHGGDSDSQWVTTEDESNEDGSYTDDGYDDDSEDYSNEEDGDDRDEGHSWAVPDGHYYCDNCGCIHPYDSEGEDGGDSNEDGDGENECEGGEAESIPPLCESDGQGESDADYVPGLGSSSSTDHSSPDLRPVRSRPRTGTRTPSQGPPSLIEPASSGDYSDAMPPLSGSESDDTTPVRVSIPSPNRMRRQAPRPVAIGERPSNQRARPEGTYARTLESILDRAASMAESAGFRPDLMPLFGTPRPPVPPPRDQAWILSQAREVQTFLSAYTAAYVPAYTRQLTRTLNGNGHVDVGCGVYTCVYMRTYMHAYLCAVTACMLQAADAFDAPPPMKYELTWSVYVDPLD